MASCMACLSKLAHPRQPALTGLPSLATSYSTQPKVCKAAVPRPVAFFAQRQEDLHDACVHASRTRAAAGAMTASVRQHDNDHA